MRSYLSKLLSYHSAGASLLQILLSWGRPGDRRWKMDQLSAARDLALEEVYPSRVEIQKPSNAGLLQPNHVQIERQLRLLAGLAC